MAFYVMQPLSSTLPKGRSGLQRMRYVLPKGRSGLPRMRDMLLKAKRGRQHVKHVLPKGRSGRQRMQHVLSKARRGRQHVKHVLPKGRSGLPRVRCLRQVGLPTESRQRLSHLDHAFPGWITFYPLSTGGAGTKAHFPVIFALWTLAKHLLVGTLIVPQ